MLAFLGSAGSEAGCDCEGEYSGQHTGPTVERRCCGLCLEPQYTHERLYSCPVSGLLPLVLMIHLSCFVQLPVSTAPLVTGLWHGRVRAQVPTFPGRLLLARLQPLRAYVCRQELKPVPRW